MYLTVFYTPVIQHILRFIARCYLKFFGWKCRGHVPEERRYIILAGPHTSNWDFPFMIACASVIRVRPYWMGKKAIFFFPLGWFFKWMGGYAIDRSKNNSLVDQMVAVYGEVDELCVLIPPEGTRKRREKWKSGFYHIAQQANIPLVLGYLDYAKKEGGFGEVYWVTDDYDADMKYIQEFYASKGAKYPKNFAGEYLDQS
ncbi:MAG: lysophospholipid acyltransferase family protein [Candidatus Hydrogenedentota bacterium]